MVVELTHGINMIKYLWQIKHNLPQIFKYKPYALQRYLFSPYIYWFKMVGWQMNWIIKELSYTGIHRTSISCYKMYTADW